MAKISWGALEEMLIHRAKVYADEAEVADTDIHGAFLVGKSGGYANISDLVRRKRNKRAVLTKLREEHRRLSRSSQRAAGYDPEGAAMNEGASQAYRETIRDILAAAGELPYAE